MLTGSSLKRADIITGILLAILGSWTIYGGFQMPMGGSYGGVDNPWYASPAAFPIFIGSLLTLAGISVSYSGIRTVGLPGMGLFLKRTFKAPLTRPSARRGTMVAVLLAIYYTLLKLPLFGNAHYVTVSGIFLASFALTFSKNRTWRISSAIILGSFLVAAGVAALFSGPLRVPLP